MNNRWTMLAVLFLARTTMAFQFQSMAALSPLVEVAYGIGLAEIGLLIGLYLAPGVLVAIPGSAMSARFGDKRLVLLGLALMLAGGMATALSENYALLVAARIVAGAGGVLVNILMTKLLIDWFAGREISTAMAIFINSWPVGIALASFLLPRVAVEGGISSGWWATAAFVAAGGIGFLFYRRPPDLAQTPTARGVPADLPYAALIHAGLVWAFYNAALAMVFSFGPALFTGMGRSLAEAGSLVSAFMIVIAVSIPFGGILADRTGRRDLMILISLAAFGVLMPLIPHAPGTLAVALLMALAALGAIGGGPVMSLPSDVLTPASRSFGMGLFFTIYYGVMMVAPRLAGGAAERAGDAATAFYLGAVFAVVAILALALYRRAVAIRALPQS